MAKSRWGRLGANASPMRPGLSGKPPPVTGAQVELPYSLPLRTGCDIKLQTNGTEIFLHATVRRCSVLGWTEQEGKKVLLYRAGVEFEGSGRDLLGVLAPKFPELFSSGEGLEGVASKRDSPNSPESIEVTIHMGDGPGHLPVNKPDTVRQGVDLYFHGLPPAFDQDLKQPDPGF